MSVYARILHRYFDLRKKCQRLGGDLGWSTMGDMKFLAACIISGSVYEPFDGVF